MRARSPPDARRRRRGHGPLAVVALLAASPPGVAAAPQSILAGPAAVSTDRAGEVAAALGLQARPASDYYECPTYSPLQPGQKNIAEYRCRSGQCIAIAKYCDGIPSCPDSSDEAACGDVTAAPAAQFDCLVGYGNWARVWSADKKRWCCAHEERGCPSNAVKTDFCLAAFEDPSDWPPEKRSYCCGVAKVGCGPETTTPPEAAINEPYNCAKAATAAVPWPMGKRVWCCQNKRIGCAELSAPHRPPLSTAAPSHVAPAFEEHDDTTSSQTATSTSTATTTTVSSTTETLTSTTLTSTTLTLTTSTMTSTLTPTSTGTTTSSATGTSTSSTTSVTRTGTTTTATTTTATTTTRTLDALGLTMRCSERGYAWEPLDMFGQPFQKAADAAECQRICEETMFCVHFSFWEVGGDCHLQDKYAFRTPLPGFVSGAASCDTALPASVFVAKFRVGALRAEGAREPPRASRLSALAASAAALCAAAGVAVLLRRHASGAGRQQLAMLRSGFATPTCTTPSRQRRGRDGDDQQLLLGI
mmetsp:Transcript_4613/g.13104  ORF Transcript_4613/g.13104 Transcript_4613/m.13104 type:complete len:531 (+) Transcript_4613:44-1636(+)